MGIKVQNVSYMDNCHGEFIYRMSICLVLIINFKIYNQLLNI